MTSATATIAGAKFKIFKRPRTAARVFFIKKSVKNTLILGLILAVYMYSKADSYVKDYASVAARSKLAESLGSNVGIEALLGIGHKVDTVGGFVVWNFLCLIAAAGAIWAIIFATKTFRGEEESGRTELFLGGQTTQIRHASNLLQAFGVGLVVLYALLTLSIYAIGHLAGANFTSSSSLFFSLSLLLGAAMFLAVGALTSQLMPTRSRALGLSVFIFAVFYVIRLAADTSSAHWLLNFSPLGWIEKLAPMYASDSVWLLPIAVFIILTVGLTLATARARDLGDALFNDKDSAKSRTMLLNSPFGLAFRLNRAVSLAWLAAFAATAFLYSLLAKGAIQSLSKSEATSRDLSRLSSTHATQLTTLVFMGIVFLIIMVIAMFYSSSAVGRMRDDEAKGYLDNFLVRPVSRVRWLSGRIFLSLAVIAVAAAVICLFSWLGLAAEHSSVSIEVLAKASINAIVPTVFVLGAGIFTLGFLPRLTSTVAYLIIGWSFLVTMLSSGITINHWLLDTSLLHQISLAPAASINWSVDLMIVAIATLLTLVGMLAFNRRDLQGE